MIDTRQIQAEVEQADSDRRAAMLTGDLATLERLIAPDAIYIHNNGMRESGEHYLFQVRQQKYVYTRVDMTDCTWRLHKDLAILAGTQLMEAGVVDGPTHRMTMRAVIVWELREGNWMLVHFQSTLLKPD